MFAITTVFHSYGTLLDGAGAAFILRDREMFDAVRSELEAHPQLGDSILREGGLTKQRTKMFGDQLFDRSLEFAFRSEPVRHQRLGRSQLGEARSFDDAFAAYRATLRRLKV